MRTNNSGEDHDDDLPVLQDKIKKRAKWSPYSGPDIPEMSDMKFYAAIAAIFVCGVASTLILTNPA